MWSYNKKLLYPVNIAKPDPAAARLIMSQLGGPDGELGASVRYLSQRYAQPYDVGKATLTDIGTEEMAHAEIVCAMMYQLTRNLTPEQIKRDGFDAYFVDHTTGIYPQSAGGIPFNVMTLQSTGDAITDLFEDMAAEQKARTSYDNLLRLLDDPDVREPLKFLRAREIVHFQRFGETLENVQQQLDNRNYYAYNPSFDPQMWNGRNHTNQMNGMMNGDMMQNNRMQNGQNGTMQNGAMQNPNA